jgi:hypothetical protein
MTWPQIYVLAAMILSGVLGIVNEARDRKNSAARVALCVVLLLGFRTIMALVLHAGGFW